MDGNAWRACDSFKLENHKICYIARAHKELKGGDERKSRGVSLHHIFHQRSYILSQPMSQPMSLPMPILLPMCTCVSDEVVSSECEVFRVFIGEWVRSHGPCLGVIMGTAVCVWGWGGLEREE